MVGGKGSFSPAVSVLSWMYSIISPKKMAAKRARLTSADSRDRPRKRLRSSREGSVVVFQHVSSQPHVQQVCEPTAVSLR